MLKCYNRGCGKDFDPSTNADDSCRFHPGVPFFHDAYKGWSCCNKKSVDFTEFLNIKGCEVAKHSNVKPPEPEKPEKPIEIDEPSTVSVPEITPPKPVAMIRSDFNEPLVTIEPTIAPALKQSIDNLINDTKSLKIELNNDEIPIGTICCNGGCNCSYDPMSMANTVCVHHPGVPIFHEGLKYWSCCTKRTSDFTAFLNQKGCEEGSHKWKKDKNEATSVQCRYDWHQSGSQVVIAIYGKMYHYAKSFVKVNPIRLAVSLVFPQQNMAEFNLDIELRGIINVSKTKVQMLGTKVEITLIKAEPGHWIKLDYPREIITPIISATDAANATAQKNAIADDGDDSDVDLNSVEPLNAITITEA